MIDFIDYSGKSNVGFKQSVNEDYILCDDTDFGDDIMLACIADGAGSKNSTLRPAIIATNQISLMLKRFYEKSRDLFVKNIRIILEQAMYTANDVLIAFKMGDEEGRFDYATAMTCAVIERNGRITVGHCGNTRLYVIRGRNVVQLTRDNTDGQDLVDKKAITEEQYYTAIERLRLNNGIGMYADPTFQTAQFQLRKNDVVIMTSDGVHYSYRSRAFIDILMNAKTMDEVSDTIIQTALDYKNYPDNLSDIVLWFFKDPEESADTDEETSEDDEEYEEDQEPCDGTKEEEDES